ncbi:hypothetical protein CU048_14100 [Beijerinckiaceae bacterium]|nr:hypothetical protein CU048_14100 [Beijerinckiaceae bacterium]
MCLIAEIIHTCSNEEVAHAAVASMGADFASKVGATAGNYGLSIGAFTARAVLHFEKIGGEQEKEALRAAMNGADQPILSGLQHILLPVMESKGLDRSDLSLALTRTRATSERPRPRRTSKKCCQEHLQSETSSN